MTDTPAIITRPTQAEVHYAIAATKSVDGERCEACRWFINKEAGGPSCHLIALSPTDIHESGHCDRFEAAPTKELPPAVISDAVTLIDTAEMPVFVDEPVIVADDGAVMIEALPDEATVIIEAIAPPAAPVPEDKALFERMWGSIKERIKGLNGDDELIEFKVHKNSFLIVWSNNFKDRDGEIFTEKAIDRYVARVDISITPPPELWVWHIGKAVRIGQASIVARHGHFAFAAGEFDADAKAQRARDYYARSSKKTSVSHGFAFPKDKFDGVHYHEFNTFEISLLPRGKEANRFTTLEGVKDMAVTPEKLKYLEDVFGKETVDGMLADLDERGKALEEIGAAFKDFTNVDEANVETEAAVKAVENADKDFSQLIVDSIKDTNEVLTMTAALAKQLAAYKQSTDATIAAQNETITALKQQLDDRPRSASKDEATELTSERIKQMTDSVDAQSKTIDPFWHTEVNSLA